MSTFALLTKNKNMRKLILLMVCVFASNGIFAQVPLDKGDVQFNAGVGASGWGIPIYFGVDFGIARDWTLGGEISFQSDSDSYYGNNKNYKYDSRAIGIGINGNYHFNRIMDIPSNFDFYAGPAVTFFIWDYKDYDNDYPEPDNASVGLGVQVGGRYFFTDKFGVNLEFGGGTATSGAKVGVTFKP